MGLVAATALGLASASLIAALMDPDAFTIYKHDGQYLLLVATMTLLAWTLTPLLLAVIIRREPPDREQPGFIACVSVALTIPLLIIGRVGYGIALLAKRQNLELYAWILGPIQVSACSSGIAVAAAWATLVIAGRWRPVASWSDLWGRVVGTLWVILSMTAKACEVLIHV